MFSILKFKDSGEVRHYRGSADALAADCAYSGIEADDFDLIESANEPVLGWNGKLYLTSADVPAAPAPVANAERIAELQAYLAETDWYVSRFAETGVAVPEDVKTARQAAREEISRLRGDTEVVAEEEREAGTARITEI